MNFKKGKIKFIIYFKVYILIMDFIKYYLNDIFLESTK